MSHWTFGRKIAAGFSVAGLTLLLVGIAGYASTHRSLESSNWVTHTLQVRGDLARLLSLYEGAETAQRGFVITAKEELLEPYRLMLTESEKVVSELGSLTADNPAQQQRIESLRSPLAVKQAMLKKGLDERRENGFEAAARVVASAEARAAMESLRRIISDMDAEEARLLVMRRTAAEDSAALAQNVILGGGVLGMLLSALLGALLVRSLSQQIGVAAQHMQSSSAELQTAAKQQASGAREQATAMSEISTTMSELLATSRQIAESARRVSEIAEQATTSARAGALTVEQGQEAMTAMRRQVDLIVSHMLELGKKSQQIGGVLDIVSELAEQTNILAINATIEATVAGEAGKRFAVVADEIRKLADRVGASTKEIRGLIEDVRAAVNTTVMTTETGSKAVEAVTKQFLDVAGAFRQIGVQVVTTTGAAREIGLTIKQQTTAVEQVNVAVGNVAQAAKEREVSTGQTLQTASQISALSADLLRLVRPQARSSSRVGA